MLKKVRGFFLLPLPLLLILTSYSHAEDCKKLLAYGNPEYPPYLWRSSEDPQMLVGANVDFLNLLKADTRISIEVQYGGTWARVQEEARQGRVDLIAGAFLTSERLSYLQYLEPPLTVTRSIIWMNAKDLSKYSQWADLKGLQGVTVINNSFGQKFDDYAKENLTITTVATLRQAFEMLKNKRVKYLIYEEWPSRAYVSRHKVSEVKFLEPPIAEEPLYLVIAKKSSCASKSMITKIRIAHQKLMTRNPMPSLIKENSARWDGNSF